MRPRHKAAENMGLIERDVSSRYASMRPRHKAAENANDGKALALNNDTLQ